jgi:hypothetical protein
VCLLAQSSRSDRSEIQETAERGKNDLNMPMPQNRLLKIDRNLWFIHSAKEYKIIALM